jgi:CPA2 family monovalent cation:H+ antiporter-2
VLLKTLVAAASVRALGYPTATAVATGLLLAQIGEFSFVLARAGAEINLYPAGDAAIGEQAFLAASVLAMLATPVLGFLGDRAWRRLGASAPTSEDGGAVQDPHVADDLNDHVIIAGYGAAARQLVRVLRRVDVPFLVATLSPEGANEAEAAGIRVLRGDYARQHVLEHAGIFRARTLVVADDDLAMAHRVAQVARPLNSDLHIVVRTRRAAEIDHLHAAGASCVIADEMESIVQLFAQILQDRAVPAGQIDSLVNEVRGADYASLLENGTAKAPVTLTVSSNASTCAHLDQVRPVFPGASGCEECLRSGDTWVHLRLCMTCGHVGCCDSSANKHASRHHRETGHPIVRSYEPGETWAWCYVDERML